MLSTTFPALVAVVIVMHVVLAWRQRTPERTCVLIPDDGEVFTPGPTVFEQTPKDKAEWDAYWLSQGRTPSGSLVTVDPAVIARVRAYCALSMVERYGAHGPP
jgi:hypothetical protein